MITTISFDAGGVLVNPSWPRVAAALRAQGVDVDAGALAAAEPRAKRRFDRAPTIDATNDAQRGWLYFNSVLEGAGITPSDATTRALEELRVYHTQNNLWESVMPGAFDVLAELRQIRPNGGGGAVGRLRLIVISNANGRLHALLARVRLLDCFDVVVDSFLEGVEKPDPRLFQIAAERAGSTPGETLHVGDLYHVDVAGARAAGMLPLLLDVADLYTDADCPRVRSLSEIPSLVRRSI